MPLMCSVFLKQHEVQTTHQHRDCLQASVPGKIAAKGGLKRLRKAAVSESAADAKRGKAEEDAVELMDDIPSPKKARALYLAHLGCPRSNYTGIPSRFTYVDIQGYIHAVISIFVLRTQQ